MATQTVTLTKSQIVAALAPASAGAFQPANSRSFLAAHRVRSARRHFLSSFRADLRPAGRRQPAVRSNTGSDRAVSFLPHVIARAAGGSPSWSSLAALIVIKLIGGMSEGMAP